MRFSAVFLMVGLSAIGFARADTPVQPRRIVTLVPSLGELAAQILGEEMDRIVGVSEYTDFPPRLALKKSIGPYHRFNLETVIELKPDLALATTDGNSKDQIERLQQLKIPVVVVSTQTLAEVEVSMRTVAAALGYPERGEKMAAAFHAGIEAFKARAAQKRLVHRRVLLQLGDRPVVVAGGKSLLNELVALTGAKNVYEESGQGYPRPSIEDVIQRNPDMILVLALAGRPEEFEKMANAWKRFPNMNAVKNGRIHVLRADELLRPSLRMLDGLSQLNRMIREE